MSADPEIRYLGDGVSAFFDGFSIWLTTPREDGTHRIALEPEVFDALCEFADELNRARRGPVKKRPRRESMHE